MKSHKFLFLFFPSAFFPSFRCSKFIRVLKHSIHTHVHVNGTLTTVRSQWWYGVPQSVMRNSIRQNTIVTQAHHCYFPLPWIAPDLVVGFAGCGIIVISSLIFNGFKSESFDLDDGDAGAFFLSITLFATTLCAEYTWFSNCLYIPNVAVQTVHLYDRCAGFNVIPWSRATWFNNFHWYT